MITTKGVGTLVKKKESIINSDFDLKRWGVGICFSGSYTGLEEAISITPMAECNNKPVFEIKQYKVITKPMMTIIIGPFRLSIGGRETLAPVIDDSKKGFMVRDNGGSSYMQ